MFNPNDRRGVTLSLVLFVLGLLLVADSSLWGLVAIVADVDGNFLAPVTDGRWVVRPTVWTMLPLAFIGLGSAAGAVAVVVVIIRDRLEP